MPYRGLIGGPVGRWLLSRWMTPERAMAGGAIGLDDPSAGPRDGLARFGPAFFQKVRDAVVVDYGCGYGQAVLGLARAGAQLAIGLDIRDSVLALAEERARQAGVLDRCRFINSTKPYTTEAFEGTVDVIVSMDAFPHYPDAECELRRMRRLLRPGGDLYVAFGMPWWHPNGCQMMAFGAPPWAHVLFTERTILALRSRYRWDGACRFDQVEGGLNRMTVRRFEGMVRRSDFRVRSFRCIPIRRSGPFGCLPLARELFTSIVQAELVAP